MQHINGPKLFYVASNKRRFLFGILRQMKKIERIHASIVCRQSARTCSTRYHGKTGEAMATNYINYCSFATLKLQSYFKEQSAEKGYRGMWLMSLLSTKRTSKKTSPSPHWHVDRRWNSGNRHGSSKSMSKRIYGRAAAPPRHVAECTSRRLISSPFRYITAVAHGLVFRLDIHVTTTRWAGHRTNDSTANSCFDMRPPSMATMTYRVVRCLLVLT